MQYLQPLSAAEKEERAKVRAEREAQLRDKNNRLGLNVFQGSWIMVFVCLIVINWQMRFSPEWIANGAPKPDFVLPTIATLALLASTLMARQAVKAIQSGAVRQFLSQWQITIGLGIVFFAIMISQFFALEGGIGQYVAVYRLMIGYHALHAIVIGGMMIQVYRYGLRGAYHATHHWSVEASAKLWYFVTIAWIMFYIVLYLI